MCHTLNIGHTHTILTGRVIRLQSSLPREGPGLPTRVTWNETGPNPWLHQEGTTLPWLRTGKVRSQVPPISPRVITSEGKLRLVILLQQEVETPQDQRQYLRGWTRIQRTSKSKKYPVRTVGRGHPRIKIKVEMVPDETHDVLCTDPRVKL